MGGVQPRVPLPLVPGHFPAEIAWAFNAPAFSPPNLAGGDDAGASSGGAAPMESVQGVAPSAEWAQVAREWDFGRRA